MNKKGDLEDFGIILAGIIIIILIFGGIIVGSAFLSAKTHAYNQGIDCDNFKDNGWETKMVGYTTYGIYSEDCYIKMDNGKYVWLDKFRGVE